MGQTTPKEPPSTPRNTDLAAAATNLENITGGEHPKHGSAERNLTALQRSALGTVVLVAAGGILAGVFGLIPPRNIPPQLSDFTPPYTCPATNGPLSCTKPIKVAVKCVDLRTVDPRNRKRPPTRTELFNTDRACELLPQWLDQDPRIQVVEPEEAELMLIYKLSPSGVSFTGAQVFLGETNFGIIKGVHEDIKDEASYFVERSLIELGNRGYLP